MQFTLTYLKRTVESVNQYYISKRFDGIRNSYLFNWYSYDRNLPNFFTIMGSINEETIYKTALYVEKLLRHYNILID